MTCLRQKFHCNCADAQLLALSRFGRYSKQYIFNIQGHFKRYQEPMGGSMLESGRARLGGGGGGGGGKKKKKSQKKKKKF